MWIMIVCGVLLLAGLAAGIAWSGTSFESPSMETELSAAEVARRYAWYVAITLTAGIAAGITVIGAGGRLAMRLLAVTAGDDAQGRLTEADEIVGAVTVDGTVGFVVFNGIFGGVILGTLYLVVRRALPAGRLGGVAYGLGLLVVGGSVVDPLRRDNPDFDIVGPGWVAVLVFVAVAIGFGLAIEGLTSRMSRWLPLPSTERRTLLQFALPGAVAVIAFTVTAIAVMVGALAVVVTRWRTVVDVVRSRRWVSLGRVLLVVVVVLSLPNSLSNVADIVGR